MYNLDHSGKTGLVFGVANHRSLALGIAEMLHQSGAQLAFAYQNERLRGMVEKAVSGLGVPLLLECDVTRDEDLERTFSVMRKEYGHLDFLVHSVAYALSEDLEGAYRETSRGGFRIALEISAYSLIPMARLAAPLMESRGGSIVALSYLGAERAVANYNVMGTAKAALEQAVKQLSLELGAMNIRINAISAGPVSTLSARGVGGFRDILKIYEERAPLRRNITKEEVGSAALFLLSEMASGVTGATLYVDSGYHIVGY
jgi:enoyl-[acyl-carrier protein] reductase I